jgi:preprotein translocase subunit SecD
MVLYEQERSGNEPRPIPLHGAVVLTGADVSDARVAYDQNNQPSVSLSFKARGASVFCDVTTRSVGKRFAIILDDVVRSAPSIRERICGGAASIEMASADDPLRDAQNLAIVLRTGSLDAPVLLADVRTVGAQLGKDSIRSSTFASVLGSLLVFVYMAIWYRVSGLVANFALLVNVLLVLAALCQFQATLTLPGIAALALTVGMAVDANIIIYERIREELKAGVLPRKAVELGFDRAAVAILDSNITSAIAGIVLYSYGTGPIKGFAVTLIIGIVTTLVTALFVSRALMAVLTRNSAARLSI